MNALGGKSTVSEPGRTTPVFGEFDVVVLGGGPAGMAAAASAARAGAKTLLVERYGFLGGMGTAAGVTNFCGLHANVHGEFRRVVRGISSEFTDRIDRLGGLNWPPHVVFGKIMAQAYDTAAFKCAADDLMESAGVELLYHALGAGCIRDGERIETLLLETKSGRVAVHAQVFIDASGDGDLAHWAGAPTELGDNDGNFLYPTSMFRIGGVDPARAGNAWETIPRLMEAAESAGTHTFPRKGAMVRPQKNPFEWRVNVTQIREPDGRAIDATDARALSRGEIEGRKQIREFLGFLREQRAGIRRLLSARHSAADRHSRVAPRPGRLCADRRRRARLRRLRRHDRRQWLADRDARQGRHGDEIPALPGIARFQPHACPHVGGRRPANLLTAGRCGSMTHLAQAAARVTGGCFVMGEAAGVLAAFSLAENGDVRAVDSARVQERLAANGAFLGRPNEPVPEGV
jgi:hypothetical protein